MSDPATNLPAIRDADPLVRAVDFAAAASSVERWTDERRDFVRRHFCGGAPEHMVELFLRACERRGLSPEDRQAYLIKRGGNYSIETGIDGYRALAARTGAYAGSDPPVYEWDAPGRDGKRRPVVATVTVWRMVRGERCAFAASAFFEEFNAGSGQWPRMPAHMLGKVAEAHALRKAFPVELSGIYTDDEMAQAGEIVVRARETTPADPVPAQPVASDDALDWTALWAWARPRGFVNGKAAEAKIGPIDVATETPAGVKARMETWLAERAEPTEKSVDRVALDALHAAARDRGLDPAHPALKVLQAIWADRWPDRAHDSLTTWPAADLRRFRSEVSQRSPAELAELVAGAAEPEPAIDATIDPPTGEIPNEPPVLTAREKVLAEVRDRAQACRTADDWRALAAEMPEGDEEAWAVVAGEARTPATVNVLLAAAKEAGALTRELREALHRAATRARNDLAATGP